MKAIHFIYLFIGIFLVYQNCSPAPNQDSPTEVSGPGVTKGSVGSLDTSRPIVLSPESAALQIDLTSGEILASREASYVSQCLDNDYLHDINQFINDSSICETRHEVPQDAVCTMIYKFPYIEIFVKDEKDPIKLGEETSGCPEVTLGLCENNEAFKALIKSLDPEQHIQACP